ncbi:kinase-like domain-containing protein [Suillus lakei]|nr:kinase-like domain-containing protein [Suillus lakei]
MGDLLPESVDVNLEPIPIPATQESIKFKIKPIPIPATDIERLRETSYSYRRYSDVWKCLMTRNGTQRLVAVKSIRISQENYAVEFKETGRRIYREMYVWMQLEHDHILPFEGAINARKFGPLPALVSPWMEEGSLNNYLKNKFPILIDVQKRELIRQVATGVRYLHGEGVVHGDLTAMNILVDGSGCVRLAGFSLSMILAEAGNPMFNSCHTGSTRWIPPEVFSARGEDEDEAIYDKPTKAGDIYSYGCVVLQIFSGNHPYAWITEIMAVYGALLKGHEPFRDIQPHGVYQQLSTCLNKVPADRPTIDDIMGILGPQ